MSDSNGDQFSPTPTLEPFPPHGSSESDVEPGFKRFEPLPTPNYIRRHFLFGIPTKSPLTGEELMDETIQEYIDQSISEIEHSLNLYISPVTINDERHDYAWEDFFYAYGWLQLNYRPVLEIIDLKVAVPGYQGDNMISWPTTWIKVYNAHGTVQLTPLAGSGSVLTTMVGSGASFPIRLFSANHFPQFWAVSYRTGFENDKVPVLLNELIAVNATLRLLNMMGPVLFPFASHSVNIDGLGQAVSYPGFTWLAGRIQQLTQKRQELIDSVKTYYELSFHISVLG